MAFALTRRAHHTSTSSLPDTQEAIQSSTSSQTTYGDGPPTGQTLTTIGQPTASTSAVEGSLAYNSVAQTGAWGATQGLSTDTGSKLASGWNNLSSTAHDGIYAGAGVCVAVLLAAIAFLLVRKRRRSEKSSFAKRTKGLRESFISGPQQVTNGFSGNGFTQPEKTNDFYSYDNAASYPPRKVDYSAYAGPSPVRATFAQDGRSSANFGAFEQPYRPNAGYR